MEDKRAILLLDTFNILISQNSVANIIDENANPTGMYLSTLNMIKIFVDKFKPIKVFVVLDGPNAGERRRKIYPNYKGKRKIIGRKSKITLVEGEEDDEMVDYEVEGAFESQLKKVYDFLKLLPVTICIVPYCEADDIITYICKKNEDKYKCIIVSTDKDYLQLVNDNIEVYSWQKKKLYSKNEFIKEHNILPENYIFKKIIRGDDSDEIDGIKGIGVKTFDRIFSKILLENKLNGMMDFLNEINSITLEEVAKKDHKHINNIQTDETKKELLKSFELMKLSTEYLKIQYIEILRKQIEEQKNKTFNILPVKMIMIKDSFNKIFGAYQASFKPENWLYPFKLVKNSVDITI